MTARAIRKAGWSFALGVLLLACERDPGTRLEEARALQELGQFAESTEVLGDVLEAHPELSEASYRLGLALVRTGEPMRAVWPLQRAVADDAHALPAGILLASLYLETRNFDEAVRAADRVLAREPDHAEALSVRGSAHLAARRVEAARADAERLVALMPDDYASHVLYASTLADQGLLDQARVAYGRVKALGAASEDPRVRQRACIAPALFAHRFLNDHHAAGVLLEACVEQGLTDLVAIDSVIGFFDDQGAPERSTDILRRAADASPDDLTLALALATRLARQGDHETAERRLLDATRHFASAAAWAGLASYYRGEGRYPDAIRALEETLELQSSPDPSLRFTLADVLIDAGELERADAIASSLEHETYAHLIRGRILLLSGEPAAALAELDQGLRAWPNNPGARFLAGIAARELGLVERALAELREAVRAGNAETHAALELARLHYQRGELERAGHFARLARAGAGGPKQPEPYVIAARAASDLGDYERALRAIERLERNGSNDLALRERALLERSRGDPAAAVRAIEAHELDVDDPVEREIHAQLVQALAEAGRGDEALVRAQAALERSPGIGALHQIHGLALLGTGRVDEARRALLRAIEIDGESAVSTAGLARLRHARGDFAGAVLLFDHAAALDPDDPSHAYAAAQLVLAGGDLADAETRLRAVVARSPGLVEANNDLAWLLAEAGRDLDFALQCIEIARQRSDAPEILDTQGWVQFRRGDFQAAVAAFERALAARPDSPSMRYRMARALEGAGDLARARRMLEAALAAGPFPDAEAARHDLARLRQRDAS